MTFFDVENHMLQIVTPSLTKVGDLKIPINLPFTPQLAIEIRLIKIFVKGRIFLINQ